MRPLRKTLLAMAETDQRVRAELVREGTLFLGYHPRMAEVHHRNALQLTSIMDVVGWPSPEMVGTDACDAAWLVLQHSIGDPAVMRRGLALLQAGPPNAVAPAQLAMLEDRVRTMSGLPQRYGTQFDWNDRGELAPREIEDAEGVEERRRAAGLPPLAEKLSEMRENMARAGQRAPSDFAARRKEIEEWEVSVGWHS
ncbi:MAG: hypothetical protein JWM95_3549 [Gemmatimonadetes bacterium]|nr:hypothetical protein [Gemmatimonadota bacterium]